MEIHRCHRLTPPPWALLRLALGAFPIWFCASCHFMPPDTPILRAPTLGEAWARSGYVDAWLLDAGGESVRVEPGSRIELELEAGRTSPIFLRARVAASPGALRPLGAVWPHCVREGELDATAAGGWVATVCELLLRADPDLAAAVDWARMEAELTTRLDDPWVLDPARSAERLAQGAFTALDLRQAPAFPLRVPFEGRLPIDESPAAAPLARDAEGRLVLSLAAGQHAFLAPGLALRIAVSAEGAWAACLERSPLGSTP